MKSTILGVVLASCIATVYAQPPAVLQLVRETIKEGKGAPHRRAEREFVSAFRKVNFPYHYIALTTESGPSEVWFFTAMSSFGALEDSDKLSGKEPLKTLLETAEAHDGEMRVSSRTMTAAFRPDLTYVSPSGPPLSKFHYMMISTYRVKLGHDEDFATGSKQIMDAYKKAQINSTYLVYQVVTGAPEGTYLLMFPMTSLKEIDEYPAREKAMTEAMGAENFQRMMRSAGDVFMSMDTTLFAISPEMSYVSKETEDGDPAFWRPKTVTTSVPKSADRSGQ